MNLQRIPLMLLILFAAVAIYCWSPQRITAQQTAPEQPQPSLAEPQAPSTAPTTSDASTAASAPAPANAPASAPAQPPQAGGAPTAQPVSPPPSRPMSPEQRRIAQLTETIENLRAEILLLRQELAQAELDRAAAQREADEMRQFIEDHREFGDDFARYRTIVEITEREARQRAAEQARERREQEQAQREARRRAAMLQRHEREAEQLRVARYRRSGFSPLGLDVFASRMSYFYETRDGTRTRIAYDPFFGPYTKVRTYREVDYSQMTISGSILNGSEQVRNIGVAIAFFDEHGNQVGHETIQINNARPDVPYPFTSTIAMALDRPFESSSVYVLYADVVDAELEQ